MENKFFTLFKPYFSYIDNGHFFRKPFSWLYALFAILNLLAPLFIFYQASKNNIFDSPFKFAMVFFLLWALIALAGWLSFQLWWDRRSDINMSSNTEDDFVATPVFSHFIQTFGEWFGTCVGLIGTGSALLTTIFLGREGYNMGRMLGIPGLDTGWIAVFTMPIIGFMIIVISRFLSEQIRALASIANNTKSQVASDPRIYAEAEDFF